VIDHVREGAGTAARAGAKEYSTPIDVWSLGCIMAELLTKEVLFPGKSELDQVGRIMALLGPPTAEVWPGAAALPHINKARGAVPCAGPAAGQAGFLDAMLHQAQPAF